MTILSFTTGVSLSLLSALGTYMDFMELQWGTVTNLRLIGGVILSLLGALVAYAHLVKVYRYRNVKRLMTKYGYNDDFKSYEHMTVEIAQEIYFNLARYDMPFLFEFGWIINFLKVSDIFHRAYDGYYSSYMSSLALPFGVSVSNTSLVPSLFLGGQFQWARLIPYLLLQLEFPVLFPCMQAALGKDKSVQIMNIVIYHARAIFSQPTSDLLMSNGP